MPDPKAEWPTTALVISCYAAWAIGTGVLAGVSLLAGVILTACAIALQASLQHEVIHGHPFRTEALNEALVFPALNLVIPYERFRDTHLAHHYDASLTDPYDDPESNYLSHSDWVGLPAAWRVVRRFNNTLLGRVLIGPIVSQLVFMGGDWALWRAGDRSVLRGWALHLAGVALVVAWLVWAGSMPLWAYGVAAYLSVSLIKIRTFAEHRAHAHSRARSVVIEDRGLLALLFLNNNFHAVHHMHPTLPWHALPARYAQDRVRVLRCNEGYVYASYMALFRQHALRAKDEVVHPLWHRD